jgi:hypothetical protein
VLDDRKTDPAGSEARYVWRPGVAGWEHVESKVAGPGTAGGAVVDRVDVVGGDVVDVVGTVAVGTVVVVVTDRVPPGGDWPGATGRVVVVATTVVTVVDVTSVDEVVTVVVDVVDEPGRVVVVTVVVGVTTVVLVAPGPGAAVPCDPVRVPTAPAGGVATSTAPARIANTPIPFATRLPVDRRGRPPCRNPPYCPCCMAPPSAHRGPGASGRHRCGACSGNPADSVSPVVLRPLLAEGLPCSAGPVSCARCLMGIVRSGGQLPQ